MLSARMRAVVLASGLLVAVLAHPAAAQRGDVRGVVRDESARPVPLAYVMALASPDAILEPLAGTVTDSSGRYLIRGLEAGEVFLRVRRIGWRLSEPVRVTVTAQGTAAADLVAGATPIQLATVKVIASPPCLDRRTLQTEPQIQELWSSASDAVRTRAAIIGTHAFSERRRFLTVRAGSRPDTTQNTDSTFAHDPTPQASGARPAPPRAQRGSASQLFGSVQRTGLLRRGWRVSLRAPSDGILTSDEFLTDYCILASVESDSTGDLLVRFRPIDEDPDAITVTGVVRLDAADGRMKRVDYEYRHDRRSAGTGSIVYGLVPIDGLDVSWVSRVEILIIDFRRNVPYADFRIDLTPGGFRRILP